MSHTRNRLLVLILLAVSVGVLIPGLFMPVLSIRGKLTRDGVARIAPLMLQKGLGDETVDTLKAMMSPSVLAMLQFSGGDLRKILLDRLTPQVTAALQKGVEDVEVYQQTRSIVSSVRNLYDVGSPFPATLILLFSVIVPLTKAALVAWATFMTSATARRRTVGFVETIAKWSMADVFVVALFITYLAAQATQSVSGDPTATAPLVTFDAQFGPGFYWFASYCLFSLASQQYTARLVRASLETP